MRKEAEIEQYFAPREALQGLKNLFLVGIGGAGLSGLAEAAHRLGYKVSGSDSNDSETLDRLAGLGISVRVGHRPGLPEGTEAVVLTDAVEIRKSPEAQTAIKQGIPLFRRSQLLGHLVSGKRVLAVTGTHGKTTTSGMAAAALEAAGADPMAIIGAPLVQWNSPIRMGNGDWAVVEACEAYNGMLDIDPEIVLLTNLEMDHEDFHQTFEHLEASIIEFLEKTGPTGQVYYTDGEESAKEAVSKAHVNGASSAVHSELDPLLVRGRHNLKNGSLALDAVSSIAGLDREALIQGIRNFQGAKRRLEVLQEDSPVIIDDYAHTPTEIEASLQAVKEKYPDRPITVVYQPHLYSRTHGHESAFAKALDHADKAFITDIYPAREQPIPGTSSAVIAERMAKPVTYVPCRHLLPREVASQAKTDDVIVGMGAGSIESFAPDLIREFRCRPIGTKRRLRVVVAKGGDSSEREVSLLSAGNAAKALEEKGVEAILVDFSDLLLRHERRKKAKHPDIEEDALLAGSLTGPLITNAAELIGFLTGPDRPDAVFLGVHGSRAEDGAIQGMLEMLHIPYTGSGIMASALAMDKAQTKKILEREGIRTARGAVVTDASQPCPVPLPAVVKPNAEGSTIGLTFVRQPEEYQSAVERALQYGGAVLVEEEIVGMEVSTPVLNGRALLPVEIAPVSGVYDFTSKYQLGGAEEIVPARLPEAILQECQRVALAAHNALGCSGATRTDMIVDPNSDPASAVTVLEINTLPGLAETSLLPASAKGMGMSFADVCMEILEDALRRHAEKA